MHKHEKREEKEEKQEINKQTIQERQDKNACAWQGPGESAHGFKHSGRILLDDDDNTKCMDAQLRKAQQEWKERKS